VNCSWGHYGNCLRAAAACFGSDLAVKLGRKLHALRRALLFYKQQCSFVDGSDVVAIVAEIHHLRTNRALLRNDEKV
jgi:hypothetical protein